MFPASLASERRVACAVKWPTKCHGCATRDQLQAGIMSKVDGVQVNGDETARLPHMTNLAFEGVDHDRLLFALDGIAVSTGSACTAQAWSHPTFWLPWACRSGWRFRRCDLRGATQHRRRSGFRDRPASHCDWQTQGCSRFCQCDMTPLSMRATKTPAREGSLVVAPASSRTVYLRETLLHRKSSPFESPALVPAKYISWRP